MTTLEQRVPDASHSEVGGLVCGAADDAVRTDDPASRRDRAVVLADVDAVGAGGEGRVGPVVDDEERAVLRAQGAGLRGGREDFLVGRRLVAELEHVDAPTERGGEDL